MAARALLARAVMLRIIFVLALLACVVGCGAPPAEALGASEHPAAAMIAVPGVDLSVRSGHPRLWILPEDRELLRCRAGLEGGAGCGASAELWQRLQADIDYEIGEGDDGQALRQVHRFAFAYLVTGDPKYCDAVVPILEAEAQSGALAREGFGPGRSSTVALAYDWCHDQLPAPVRSSVGAYLLENAKEFRFNGTYPWFPGESSGLVYALSIFGDGIDDASSGELLAEHYVGFREVQVPATNAVYCDGGLDGYAGVRADFMRAMTDLFARSSTYTAAFDDVSFVHNLARFFIHRTRGDGHLSRAPGKNNLSGIDVGRFAAHAALRLGDPHLQWFASQEIARDPSSTDWEQLVWFDPGLPATAPDDPAHPFGTAHEGTCSGMYYFRTDWTPDAVHAGFFNGPDLVSHRTQNHFIIARGDDSLAIDSGARTTDYDLSYDTYYRRSIAHNTVAIFDPEEDFGDAPLAPGVHIPNDGGQIGGDEVAGCQIWPDACTPSGNAPGYRGQVLAFDVLPDAYRYVLGDATAAYAESKSERVVRAFTELDPGIFVIFDRVVAKNPSFETAFHLHMIERPVLDGSLDVLEGALETGGVFESDDSKTVTVRYGDSALVARTIVPERAVMRIVGGANADGESVKQTQWPEHAFSHSSSASYEYENGGVNWTPESTKYPYSEADHYGRNGGASGTPPGGEAGDYRVEVRAAAGEPRDTFLHVLSVGAGDPMLDDDDAHFTAGAGFERSTYSAYGHGMYRGSCRVADADASATARWVFEVAAAGEYDVEVWLPKSGSATLGHARYELEQASKVLSAEVDQADGQARWVTLGRRALEAGGATLQLTPEAPDSSEHIVADAARLRRVDAAVAAPPAKRLASQDGRATGVAIGSSLVALFNDGDTPLEELSLKLDSTSGARVRVFGVAASTEFSVAHDGTTLAIAKGSGKTSTDAGVLSFELGEECPPDGTPCTDLGDDDPPPSADTPATGSNGDRGEGCTCTLGRRSKRSEPGWLWASLLVLARRRRRSSRRGSM